MDGVIYIMHLESYVTQITKMQLFSQVCNFAGTFENNFERDFAFFYDPKNEFHKSYSLILQSNFQGEQYRPHYKLGLKFCWITSNLKFHHAKNTVHHY